jgi:uncharacterized membrane protein
VHVATIVGSIRVGPGEIMRLAAGALVMGFLLLGFLHMIFAPLVRKMWGSDRAAEFDNLRALDALWERYERSEISWDKHQKMSRDLENKGST